MAPVNASRIETSRPTGFQTPKGTRILAQSFYRTLRQSGMSPQEVLKIFNELLDLVTDDMKKGFN